MTQNYKPKVYNSLSAYLIVDNAEKLATQLKNIFGAVEMRRMEFEGSLSHLELKIDDSILMISNSVPDYPAQHTTMHCYVPDVHETYRKALENGGEKIENPIQKEGDSDIRGSFYDIAGNYWAISTQKNLKQIEE